jgi:hypothetical protein
MLEGCFDHSIQLPFCRFVYLFCWSGTEFTRTEDNYWRIVSALDDRWWYLSSRWHEWLARETEVIGENLPQLCFVHKNSNMIWLGSNPCLRGGKPAINRLSYGRPICGFMKWRNLSTAWATTFFSRSRLLQICDYFKMKWIRPHTSFF